MLTYLPRSQIVDGGQHCLSFAPLYQQCFLLRRSGPVQLGFAKLLLTCFSVLLYLEKTAYIRNLSAHSRHSIGDTA